MTGQLQADLPIASRPAFRRHSRFPTEAGTPTARRWRFGPVGVRDTFARWPPRCPARRKGPVSTASISAPSFGTAMPTAPLSVCRAHTAFPRSLCGFACNAGPGMSERKDAKSPRERYERLPTTPIGDLDKIQITICRRMGRRHPSRNTARQGQARWWRGALACRMRALPFSKSHSQRKHKIWSSRHSARPNWFVEP